MAVLDMQMKVEDFYNYRKEQNMSDISHSVALPFSTDVGGVLVVAEPNVCGFLEYSHFLNGNPISAIDLDNKLAGE